MVHTRRLLWTLSTVDPWVEFRTRYHDFMMTRGLGEHYHQAVIKGGVRAERE